MSSEEARSDCSTGVPPDAAGSAVLHPVIPDHELLRRIGRGSYGEVWLARNVMGTWRAVKIVRRDSFENERPYEREFAGIRRSEPVSRAHEGMVDILHIGRRDDEGFFYYVMELADSATVGPENSPESYKPLTLATRLEAGKQLPAEDCIELVTALAGVLAHLHEAGLIHRDVKPSNILFVSGVAKLGDIGLVAEAGHSRTFVGTEGYVPMDGPGTERADIFGLGKTLYEALTGFERSRFPEVPLDWSQRYDFHQCLELNEIVLRACESNPEQRYKSAREMLADAALVASGRSVRRLRRLESGLRSARVAMLALGGIAVLASAAFYWQRRESDFAKVKLAQAQSESTAASALEAARLSKWYGLQDRVRAARYDHSAGSVANGLAAAREAATIDPTLSLRDDAAFLLGHADLVVLPYGEIPVGVQSLAMNLAQRQYLRLSYRPGTPRLQRLTGRAEIIPLDGGPALPMPAGFVITHDWSLEFIEGGTVLQDCSGHRWAVPGTKPWEARPQKESVLSAEKLRLTVPGVSRVNSSHDGRWAVAFTKDASGHHTLNTFHNGAKGPALATRQRGGGAQAAFLDPPHLMATSSWLGVTWVEDLLHEQPILRIPNAGYLNYSPEQELLASVSWENDAAQVYAWRPSTVLHNFPTHSDQPMSPRFSPDERWLTAWDGNGVRWWPLDPLNLAEPARKDAAAAFGIHWQAEPPRFTILAKNGATTHAFHSTAGPDALITDAHSEPLKITDFPELHPDHIESWAASADGRVVAIGNMGPACVWRDGKPWRKVPSKAPGTQGDPVRLALSADGRRLAVGSFHGRGVWVWDLEGRQDRPILLHTETFNVGAHVALSLDGRWLSCAGDNEIRVLETTSWNIVARWPRKTHGIGETNFSADSKLLIIQPTAEEIAIIRTEKWETLITLKLPIQDRIGGLAISATGHWLSAIGTGKSDLWLWDLQKLNNELRAMGLGW